MTRNSLDNLSPGIPAATLILVSDRGAGELKYLLIERSRALKFVPGTTVFPGGRVDDDDRIIAADPLLLTSMLPDLDDATARVTAIRETLEETAIAIGFERRPEGPDVLGLRKALCEGWSFSEVLRDAGLRLQLTDLTPFARWCPPEDVIHRRFDTRFYLARSPGDEGGSADGRETFAIRWTTVDRVLKEVHAGITHMIFPTRCNLYRLAQFQSFAAVHADAVAHPVQLVTPNIWTDTDGRHFLAIPEGIGYPVTRELIDPGIEP